MGSASLRHFALGGPSIGVDILHLPRPEPPVSHAASRAAAKGPGGQWLPCLPPMARNRANRTATVAWATGPEDPRVQAIMARRPRYINHVILPGNATVLRPDAPEEAR